VIAEFKRASPSKGDIRAGARADEIARAYARAGAAALSVLTDRRFFGGGLADLIAARQACELPVLRKDFTVDPIQVAEARAAGADAILLIVSALDDSALVDLAGAAHEFGLDVLVEVHDRAELERALPLDPDVLGINNRDLRTFETDLQVTRDLLPHAGERPVISESGVSSPEAVRSLSEAGVHGFLVGEALMSAPDPERALRELRGAL
jgi:indole-3-glycerol phosphate synthase